jgi:hypothetical protein
MTHVPGHVKQGDLLTTIGSRMAVRSDTFIIRSYGESRDTGGRVLGRAWCEAVVRRTPGYVEAIDEADVVPESLSSEVNQEFGRQFEMVSFRWLPEGEI